MEGRNFFDRFNDFVDGRFDSERFRFVAQNHSIPDEILGRLVFIAGVASDERAPKFDQAKRMADAKLARLPLK